MIFMKTPAVPDFRDSVQAAKSLAKSLATTRKTTLCAALLIAVGAALRLYPLGDVPPGVHQDEASGLYDAWALLHYGIDRNGNSWPVNFVAWGSGQSVLYAYIAMPFIWIGGLDIAAFRLPMALLGAVSLWLMWRIARNAAGDKFALIALLFLSVNLWHIMATRWALDSNLLPFCLLLSAYFLSRHDRHRFAIQALAVAALSMSVYAYATAYAFAPLFLAAAFGWLALNRALTPRRFLALSAIAAAITAPMTAFLIVNLLDIDAIRALGATIPRYPTAARYERTLLFDWDWTRFFTNLLELRHLLLGAPIGGGSYLHYETRGWGPLAYLTVVAVAGLGVVLHRAIARRDFGVHLLMAMWFALALAVATLSEATVNRANMLWLPVIYLTAWGVASAFRPRAALCAAVAAFIAISGLFAYQYAREYEEGASGNFSKGLDAAINRAIESAGEDELIYISEWIIEPYIHTLYAAAAPPRQYLETRVVNDANGEFQDILAFDRFVFLSPFLRASSYPNNLKRAQRRGFLNRHLRIAGVDIDGIEHYIFNSSEYDEVAGALDADRFIAERHGIFTHVYPKDGGTSGAGAIRLDAPLVQGEPAARAEFDLHLRDGELIYFKQPCGANDIRRRFFLHITPADINDLPEERRQDGFDNLDFPFGRHGGLYGRQCFASVPLPEYGIAAVETGQTKLAREWPTRFWRQSWKRLWTAELKF